MSLTSGPGRPVETASQKVEVLERGSRPRARFSDAGVTAAIVAAKWLPDMRRHARAGAVAPLFSPLMGELRRHVAELITLRTPVFFLRDDKRGNSAMQAARDPTRGHWNPALAANLRSVEDADKPFEIVWEYEWFHSVPTLDAAARLIAELQGHVGARVARTRLLRAAGEFGDLVIEEVAKPEGPLSIDRYHDTEPMNWGAYDAEIGSRAGAAWVACKRHVSRLGWVEPPAARILGGYNIIHGSTIRKRHFGDPSQRWHTGAMNIEPFYRRPAPGLGERLEYNFYLHPESANTLDLDLAIAAGNAHPALRHTNGFHLALALMPGLRLDGLRERVQISKTRRKFELRDQKTGDIMIIINVDRIEAIDLQGRVKGSAVYYDVDVSVEGDVLKETVLQREQRFVRGLQRTWGLEPNDRTRHDRAEAQLRALAERQGSPTARFYPSVRLPPAGEQPDETIVANAQRMLTAGRGGRRVPRLSDTLVRAEQEVMRGDVTPVPAMQWARAGQRRHQTLISIADPGARFGSPVDGFFDALTDVANLDGTIFHQEQFDSATRRYMPTSVKDNAVLVLHVAGALPVTAYLRPSLNRLAGEPIEWGREVAAMLAAAASGLFRNGTTDVKIEMTGLQAAEAVALMQAVSIETLRRPGQSLTAQFNIVDADLIDDRPTAVVDAPLPAVSAEPRDRARTAISVAADGGFDRIALEGADILRRLGDTNGLRDVVHQAHSRGLETFIAGSMDAGSLPAAVKSGVGAVGVISAVHSNGALDRAKITALIHARNEAEASLEAQASVVLADLDMRFADRTLGVRGHHVRVALFEALQVGQGDVARADAVRVHRCMRDARQSLREPLR